eukprot:TRINITY_DN2996_c0_g1_i4.p1 TRINITY_DN2996_c0_g1~~TRINITY_DN2996_c0_g1_i4.p1  ORF type:complete len:436 (+),score=90.48 TRINITY_DN2996_c0_g1_i4:58-1365(+)
MRRTAASPRWCTMFAIFVWMWCSIAWVGSTKRKRNSEHRTESTEILAPLPERAHDARYITFEPWNGGWNNRRMSLENAFVIALLQNRTLVLPPGSRTVTPYEQDYDIAKMKQHVPVLSWKEFLHLRPLLRKADHSEDPKPCSEHKYRLPVFYCNEMKYARMLAEMKTINFLKSIVKVTSSDDADFDAYRRGRVEVVLPDSYWVHYPQNLFGHFYHTFYFASKAARIRVWKAVRDSIAIRSEMVAAAELIANEMGPYHAVHYRRGDFKKQFPTSIVAPADLAKNLASSTSVASQKLPLYVATDEKDENVKRELISSLPFSKTHTLSDFSKHLTDIPDSSYGVVETLVCSRAKRFTGTRLSTFSAYITRLRGYLHSSIQHINPNLYYTDTVYTSEDEVMVTKKPYSWCGDTLERYADLRGIRWTWGQEYEEAWCLDG